MADGRPTLAVVGAVGTVGSAVLELLSLRQDIWGEVRLVEVADRAGHTMTVRGEELTVRPLSPEVFDGVDIAMFDIGMEATRQWVPVATGRGAVVVDNSPVFRLEEGVPLVVPTINPAQIANRRKGIVANPSSTSLAMLDTVATLHSGWGLQELVVATYHSASDVGLAGIEQLYDELEAVAGDRTMGQHTANVRYRLSGEMEERSPFPGPLALNVLPWVGTEAGDGWSSVELAVRAETRKVLGLPDLKVSVTAVRVPVVIGHSLSVHATFEGELSAEQATRTLIEAPSVVLLDDPSRGEWPTPVDVVGSDPTFVGRIRQSLDFPRSLELFISGDNVRKGAALNGLQISEILVSEQLG